MRKFLLLRTTTALLLATCGTCVLVSRLAAQGGPQANEAMTWFAKGQAALESGNLDGAEKNFREVLARDPKSGAAHANLGVIEMRRKNWEAALAEFRRAEKLAPKMTGVRLNIGLLEFRRGRYADAIAPLISVLRDDPG